MGRSLEFQKGSASHLPKIPHVSIDNPFNPPDLVSLRQKQYEDRHPMRSQDKVGHTPKKPSKKRNGR